MMTEKKFYPLSEAIQMMRVAPGMIMRVVDEPTLAYIALPDVPDVIHRIRRNPKVGGWDYDKTTNEFSIEKILSRWQIDSTLHFWKFSDVISELRRSDVVTFRRINSESNYVLRRTNARNGTPYLGWYNPDQTDSRVFRIDGEDVFTDDWYATNPIAQEPGKEG